MTQNRTPRSGALRTLPFLAVLSWLLCLGWIFAGGLNTWGDVTLYGWDAPDLVVALLVLVSLAFLVLGLWKHELWHAYAAAVPLVVLGSGERLLLQRDGLVLFAFAASVFLLVEYISAPGRFRGILEAARGLDASEARPLQRFLFRYFIGSVGVVLLYAGFLALCALYLVPALAAVFSPRMADGLELQTAWGLGFFLLLAFGLAMLIRLLVDAIAERRQQAPRPEEPEETA